MRRSGIYWRYPGNAWNSLFSMAPSLLRNKSAHRPENLLVQSAHSTSSPWRYCLRGGAFGNFHGWMAVLSGESFGIVSSGSDVCVLRSRRHRCRRMCLLRNSLHSRSLHRRRQHKILHLLRPKYLLRIQLRQLLLSRHRSAIVRIMHQKIAPSVRLI